MVQAGLSTVACADAIPGPPRHPLGWRFNAYRFHTNPLEYMERLHREFGPVAAMHVGGNCPVFAFGPAMNRAILDNPALFQSVGVGIGGPAGTAQQRLSMGIFHLNGDEHTSFRKQVSPAFGRKALIAHYGRMVAITDSALRHWQTGAVIDLQPKTRELAFQMSLRTVLGIPPGPGCRHFGDRLEAWLMASTSFWRRMLPTWIQAAPVDRTLRMAEQLERELVALLAAERGRDADTGCPTTLQVLADAEFPQSRCPYETTQGHLSLLINAAHDTTASAIMWTLYLLAQHPRIAQALRDEVVGLAGTEPPDIDRLEKADLLERVITESLRILTPVPFSSRAVAEPVELGGYQIPCGTIVSYSPYMTHRLPDLYPNPNIFDPDRWLGRKPDRHAYLPFISGRRYCLGAGFATLTLKLVIAMVVQRFSLTLLEGARIDPRVRITLRSRHGLPVVLSGPDRPGRRVGLRGAIATLAP